MIKYLGSKRALMPQLSRLAVASGAEKTLDLFTGTTRVARMLKAQGRFVTACDIASYSEVFAKTWIELDASECEMPELSEALAALNALPGEDGYFTKNFCVDARFFQRTNGRRIDAIREAIDRDYAGSWLREPLLTSLIMAADRVDSTTGVQMAYLKDWSSRSYREIELIDPILLHGPGRAIRGDALDVAAQVGAVDLAYLDPPYNQHRYFTNYHIWETLVRWDKPPAYGVAMKRLDSRASVNHSVFNKRRKMPAAFKDVILNAKTKTLVVSYNNESWVEPIDIAEAMLAAGHESVALLEFDYKRYIGSQIGIYNKSGAKVGEVGEHGASAQRHRLPRRNRVEVDSGEPVVRVELRQAPGRLDRNLRVLLHGQRLQRHVVAGAVLRGCAQDLIARRQRGPGRAERTGRARDRAGRQDLAEQL